MEHLPCADKKYLDDLHCGGHVLVIIKCTDFRLKVLFAHKIYSYRTALHILRHRFVPQRGPPTGITLRCKVQSSRNERVRKLTRTQRRWLFPRYTEHKLRVGIHAHIHKFTQEQA